MAERLGSFFFKGTESTRDDDNCPPKFPRGEDLSSASMQQGVSKRVVTIWRKISAEKSPCAQSALSWTAQRRIGPERAKSPKKVPALSDYAESLGTTAGIRRRRKPLCVSQRSETDQ